ncbi:Killer toxin subunits alpha/beta [Tolypocladium ophioglossoides CBS 100239]|uniref:Killer toxin subunits alpha/beta n=1 Tax=Tolypocladium ophioglossoides (strain CBS 100239) TaxID=1163406 RepID=A0A0L0MY87_TOLOC|nr:Killer toxin subunits alpha/beta [Tolypocladium ophioglossoides CBS 100239]
MLTDVFQVYLEDEYAKYQFEQFKKLRGPRPVLSFGGWTFSAERPNYAISRNVSNIAKFINDNGLDGAYDIPGILPPDNINEGTAYALFLRILRSRLNSDLSIAAPAFYCDLKQFPILKHLRDCGLYRLYDVRPAPTSMITKAGVPSGKIIVGVTTYGSFQRWIRHAPVPIVSWPAPPSKAAPES